MSVRHPGATTRKSRSGGVRPSLARRTPLPRGSSGTLLPYGLGRSYGDSCLNEGGTLLTTARAGPLRLRPAPRAWCAARPASRLDRSCGSACRAGWFLPVDPGHQVRHRGRRHRQRRARQEPPPRRHLRAPRAALRAAALRRPAGACARPSENRGLLRATIGGLGLTGLILWAEVQLRRIPNPYILNETVPFAEPGRVLRVLARVRARTTSTRWRGWTAWRGAEAGPGPLLPGQPRAAAVRRGAADEEPPVAQARPGGAVRPAGLQPQPAVGGAFNWLYYHRQLRPGVRSYQSTTIRSSTRWMRCTRGTGSTAGAASSSSSAWCRSSTATAPSGNPRGASPPAGRARSSRC